MLYRIMLFAVEWRESLSRERSRLEQLLATMARVGHPMRKFTWGNVFFNLFCVTVTACSHCMFVEFT